VITLKYRLIWYDIMKFSTRSTYGLRAMIALARNWQKGSVSLASIARDENISLGYLERIFSVLKKEKLVKSKKGASGGYVLDRGPENIDVYDIISALEGKVSSFHCVENGGKVYCGKKCECSVEPALLKVAQAISAALKNIKLKDLI